MYDGVLKLRIYRKLDSKDTRTIGKFLLWFIYSVNNYLVKISSVLENGIKLVLCDDKDFYDENDNRPLSFLVRTVHHSGPPIVLNCAVRIVFGRPFRVIVRINFVTAFSRN